FFWLVVGIDPTPHRLPYAGRILYVVVALPFHTILGVALVTQTKLIAPGITLTDQQAGAGILWSAGEALGLIAMMVVAVQWMNAEEREAARHDRQLDAAVRSRSVSATSLMPGRGWRRSCDAPRSIIATR